MQLDVSLLYFYNLSSAETVPVSYADVGASKKHEAMTNGTTDVQHYR